MTEYIRAQFHMCIEKKKYNLKFVEPYCIY